MGLLSGRREPGGNLDRSSQFISAGKQILRAGSGFKLNIRSLESLALTLGFNSIPIPASSKTSNKNTVVRVNVESWQNNRMNLESLTLNPGASLEPYTPSKLAFQFIGDSLLAGQFLPKGVDQAWPFLVGEAFKAEHVVTAQPGAAFTDTGIVSYGNEHGVSFQFFRVDRGHGILLHDTTPWNFGRDKPAATHIVIHIGANDASQNVTDIQFVQVYTNFLARLRSIYSQQPIFVFTPVHFMPFRSLAFKN
ncbi:hypothetical protein R3P38DRAFT_3102067 [Favolaschia claudopus]|uniref:SGNH hydrolase-type esterase domain-containing protein n=1 Tax=Favolaschia claudopus TaxID=2862362 RepID=A0AAV9ZLT2_9AGAR